MMQQYIRWGLDEHEQNIHQLKRGCVRQSPLLNNTIFIYFFFQISCNAYAPLMIFCTVETLKDTETKNVVNGKKVIVKK